MVNRDLLLQRAVRAAVYELRQLYETPPVNDDIEYGSSYEDMAQDATAGAAVRQLAFYVLSVPSKLQPAQGGGECRKLIVDDLEDLGFDLIKQAVLSCLWRGFSCHEVVWAVRNRRFHLVGLHDVSQEQVAFGLNRFGQVTEFYSQPPGAERQRLPVEKLWFFPCDPTSDHPAGQSLFRLAGRAWRARDSLIKYWGRAVKRYGMPLIVGQVPESMGSDKQSDLLDAFYGLELDGVAIIPDGVAYAVHNPTYASTISYAEALHYWDAQIKQAILLQMQEGSVLQRQAVTGEGLAQLQSPTNLLARHYAGALYDTFYRQVLRPLAHANFGDPDLAPRWELPNAWQTITTPTAPQPPPTDSDS